MEQKKPFELIQHVLSTILLDAVQFFPQNKKKVHSEAHGLLFGMEKSTTTECDYAFPVGSVMERSDMMVMPDSKVDMAVKSAKELFSTSHCIGTYHSHPYDEYFDEWADPSNADCNAADYLNLPYFLIVAIARNGQKNEPLNFSNIQTKAHEFIYNPKAEGHDAPTTNQLDYDTTCINGTFQKYTFTIRAYRNTGKSLVDVELFSSEEKLITLLNEKKLPVSKLQDEETYRLRKMEYNLRKENEERGKGNTEYHLERLK
ncbi:hypothetical protein QRY07_05315 [Bacillus cereus]|uniref:hypothetical protein n=1 Tax=Bacillus cereus TaxID=1396 RepID=UPI0025708CF8|nr:hypothetical protein [Bacillus cereus]WJE21175.1 hypothetical protein QRY07_05315 [Bacillus cereus]